jgi:nucleotide-binding universal stress UspA family protein
MSSNPHVIVVGVDFSELGDQAFRRAFELAALHPISELHAISVTEPSQLAPITGYDTIEVVSPVRLDQIAVQLAAHVNGLLSKLEGSYVSGVRVVSHVRVDSPLLGITQLAAELQADLIVVGTHGRQGLARWLLGSVAEGVVRHASCPVLVIPPLPTMSELPKIEPACPRCIEARVASQGQELWCEQHREHHGRRHTYHQRDRVSEDASLPLVTR